MKAYLIFSERAFQGCSYLARSGLAIRPLVRGGTVCTSHLIRTSTRSFLPRFFAPLRLAHVLERS